MGETFVRVVRMTPEARGAIADLRNYLHRMGLNDTRMMRGARTRRERREWRASALPQHVELLASEDLRRSLASLSVKQRAAVFLTYWHDLAVDDVPHLMGVSTGAVKRHLAHARSKLREDILNAEYTPVAEATKDGRSVVMRVATDGVRYAVAIGPPLLLGRVGSCCVGLGDDEAILIGGLRGPHPQLLEAPACPTTSCGGPRSRRNDRRDHA